MVFEDDRPRVSVGGIDFKHGQPDVSVSAGARYVEHEVIGDTVVRQKIGESPDQITINGACTDYEASQIDDLVHEKEVTVISNRWEGIAQVDSTSTNPLSEGGAIAGGDWTHTYTIDLTGIEEQAEIIPYETLIGQIL